MKRILFVVSITAVGWLTAFYSPSSMTDGATQENRYIGAAKCKNCHQAEEKGNQYGVWENAKHAQAFATLGTPEAKKLAAAQGIADPQKSADCMRCHATAYTADPALVKKGFDMQAGVQCESCHGPGEQHMKARFRAAAEEKPDAKPEPGEILVDVTQATCLGCHNSDSPSFKPFCFYERFAEIRHARPDSKREVLVCGCDPCDCTTGCPDDGCGVPAK